MTGGRRPTLKDVASMAGVSYQTVSRVLNRPRDVRETTRSKVEDAIAVLGYEPDESARSLVRRRVDRADPPG